MEYLKSAPITLVIKTFFHRELLLLPYRFWGAPYEITKIPHPLKHPTEFYFYNVRYLNDGRHFLKLFVFPTSVV
jgi:hypothetical protein